MRRDLYGLLQSDITSGSAPWAELLTSNEFVQDHLDGTFVSADWETPRAQRTTTHRRARRGRAARHDCVRGSEVDAVSGVALKPAE
jgi:hypothetical protein